TALLPYMLRSPPRPPVVPYTTLFRSDRSGGGARGGRRGGADRRRQLPARSQRRAGLSRRAARRDGLARHAGLRRDADRRGRRHRSEEHTSELQSVSISYAVFCLKKKK